MIRRRLDPDRATGQRRFTDRAFCYPGYQSADLAYAITGHSAQGGTVHTGIALVTGTEDRGGRLTTTITTTGAGEADKNSHCQLGNLCDPGFHAIEHVAGPAPRLVCVWLIRAGKCLSGGVVSVSVLWSPYAGPVADRPIFRRDMSRVGSPTRVRQGGRTHCAGENRTRGRVFGAGRGAEPSGREGVRRTGPRCGGSG
jgi:hypothetical protein